MPKREELTVVLSVDRAKAKAAFAAQAKDINLQVDQLLKLEKGSKEYASGLVNLQKQMRKFAKEQGLTVLLKEQRKLNREIKNVAEGTREYEILSTQIKSIAPRVAKLKAEQRRLNKTVAQTSGAYGKVTGAVRKMGGALRTIQNSAFFLVIINEGLQLAKTLFNIGKSADEVQTKFNIVFGSSAEDVEAFGIAVSKNLGLTNNEFKDLTSATQDLLVPLGLQRDVAAEISTQLPVLAKGLAKWTGGKKDTAEVTEILNKALLGEREQLKTLGIAINEADIKNKLLEKGQADLQGSALKQAKALASLELIMQLSTDAQNNFINSTSSLSDKQTEANAEFNEAIEIIGIALVDAWNGLADAITPVISFIGRAIKAFTSGEEATGKYSVAINALATAFDFVAQSLKGWGLLFSTVFNGLFSFIDNADIYWAKFKNGAISAYNTLVDTLLNNRVTNLFGVTGESAKIDLIDIEYLKAQKKEAEIETTDTKEVFEDALNDLNNSAKNTSINFDVQALIDKTKDFGNKTAKEIKDVINEINGAIKAKQIDLNNAIKTGDTSSAELLEKEIKALNDAVKKGNVRLKVIDTEKSKKEVKKSIEQIEADIKKKRTELKNELAKDKINDVEVGVIQTDINKLKGELTTAKKLVKQAKEEIADKPVIIPFKVQQFQFQSELNKLDEQIKTAIDNGDLDLYAQLFNQSKEKRTEIIGNLEKEIETINTKINQAIADKDYDLAESLFKDLGVKEAEFDKIRQQFQQFFQNLKKDTNNADLFNEALQSINNDENNAIADASIAKRERDIEIKQQLANRLITQQQANQKLAESERQHQALIIAIQIEAAKNRLALLDPNTDEYIAQQQKIKDLELQIEEQRTEQAVKGAEDREKILLQELEGKLAKIERFQQFVNAAAQLTNAILDIQSQNLENRQAEEQERETQEAEARAEKFEEDQTTEEELYQAELQQRAERINKETDDEATKNALLAQIETDRQNKQRQQEQALTNFNSREEKKRLELEKKQEAEREKLAEKQKKARIAFFIAETIAEVAKTILTIKANLAAIPAVIPPGVPNPAFAGAVIEAGLKSADLIAGRISALNQLRSLDKGGVQGGGLDISKAGVQNGSRHGSGSGNLVIDKTTGTPLFEMEQGEPYLVLSRKTYGNNKSLIDQLLYNSLHRNGAPVNPAAPPNTANMVNQLAGRYFTNTPTFENGGITDFAPATNLQNKIANNVIIVKPTNNLNTELLEEIADKLEENNNSLKALEAKPVFNKTDFEELLTEVLEERGI